MQHASASPPPVFVGGTGRSGTTIVGQLIGASEAYALVPIELRFHVDAGGLCDLARGEVGLDRFETSMLKKWYVRPPNRGGPRGVHVIIDRPEFEDSLARLRAHHADDPWKAAGTFLDDVIQPLRRSQDASAWVEMTPPNAKVMHVLAPMLPTARFVNMVRDGRDVASSVVRRTWGPNDMPSAITWWGDQMTVINRSAGQVEPSRLLTLRLESLVGPQRELAYGQLTEFLGLQDDVPMRAFFESSMNEQMSHPGRWREELDAATQERVEELYAEQLARLEAAGTPLQPVL